MDKTLEIECEAYCIEDGWHVFMTYRPGKYEPYYVNYSEEIKVEHVED
jgi:hypothetical protein